MRSAWMFLVLAACEPSLDDAAYLITAPRVLAVRGEPAESTPGRAVRYQALIATPDGAPAEAPLVWAFCAAPKALTENNVVGEDCLAAANVPIDEVGSTITATTPDDACTLFGPDTPPGDFRPRDPDPTGGYYQPLLIRGVGPDAIAGERIRCNPARASAALSREYRERYAPNINPTLGQLSFGTASPDALPASSAIRISVELPNEARERYVRLDPASQTIVEAEEELTVSWFTSRGELETRRTSSGENTLYTPAEPGPLFLWVILRDSRGGADFRQVGSSVAP